MIIATTPSRWILDATLREMLDVPVDGYENMHVHSIASIDEKLVKTALHTAIACGQSYLFVHIPSEWDISIDMRIVSISASATGIRLYSRLDLWMPVSGGPGLLLDDKHAHAFDRNGLRASDLPLGVELTTAPGVARAKMRLIAAVSPHLAKAR